MSMHERERRRDIFGTGEKFLDIHFYTSNTTKFLQAAEVFSRSGLTLNHFKSRTEPYEENYKLGKFGLLTKAIEQISKDIGKESLFFVEDTSLRIEALSTPDQDVPGLGVKEWFQQTIFDDLNALLPVNGDRSAIIKSDIALHIPHLERPVFFSGNSQGKIASHAPTFSENPHYPWLTPNSFNGWFIPNNSKKCLGAMSLEESWRFDFRIQAIELLIDRIEEYSSIINLPPHAYHRRKSTIKEHQPYLFQKPGATYMVIGRTCAGKSTFGEWGKKVHGAKWIEASSMLDTFRSEYQDQPYSRYEFAKYVLAKKGADAVARRILAECRADQQTGLIITGFRTIEEVAYIRSEIPSSTIIFVDVPPRTRYKRYRARARDQEKDSFEEFRDTDAQQFGFGLLQVADQIADIRISNDKAIEDYHKQIDLILNSAGTKLGPGVTALRRTKRDLDTNQLFRGLQILFSSETPMTSQEIESESIKLGKRFRFGNVNIVLRRFPELAARYENRGENNRYKITDAGRAFVRFMEQYTPNTPSPEII